MANNLDNRALNSIGLNAAASDDYKSAFNNLKTSIDNLEKPLEDMVNSYRKMQSRKMILE